MNIPGTFQIRLTNNTDMVYFLDTAIPSTGPAHSYAIIWLTHNSRWLNAIGTSWLDNQQFILSDVIVHTLLWDSHRLSKLELLLYTGLTMDKAYAIYKSNVPNDCTANV